MVNIINQQMADSTGRPPPWYVEPAGRQATIIMLSSEISKTTARICTEGSHKVTLVEMMMMVMMMGIAGNSN